MWPLAARGGQPAGTVQALSGTGACLEGCSLGPAGTLKLFVISLRRVIVRWVLWRAFPLRSISRFGATPHGVPAGIGSGLARELHPLGLTNRLGYYGLVTLGDWGTVYQRLSGDTIKLPFGGWRCGSGLGIYTEPAESVIVIVIISVIITIPRDSGQTAGPGQRPHAVQRAS